MKRIPWSGADVVMPTHIQIETVGGKGMCTARCEMCTISQWAKPPTIMSFDLFRKLVDDVAPFREHVRYVTLHGNGEPLMDKGLPQKVAYLKERGFIGTGFASNCTLLSEKMATGLLEAGLDTIICSIDGFKKETHETIRKGTNFERIVENVQRFLRLRNARRGGGRRPTRMMVRFILQELNRDEYPNYRDFWSRQLDPSLGDEVVYFPIHNWGGQLENFAKNSTAYAHGRVFMCEDLYDRLIVFADGEVAHCDADYNGFFPHGNVAKAHFLDIFNGAVFREYREKMEMGKLLELKHCSTCSIPTARASKGS